MAYSDYQPKACASTSSDKNVEQSVWGIMRSRVNDNTPGYLYWFSRIMTASVGSLCVIEFAEYIF